MLLWPAVGLLSAFLVAGAFTRDPGDLELSAVGCVVADDKCLWAKLGCANHALLAAPAVVIP